MQESKRVAFGMLELVQLQSFTQDVTFWYTTPSQTFHLWMNSYKFWHIMLNIRLLGF
jgi:hypothetical protein